MKSIIKFSWLLMIVGLVVSCKSNDKKVETADAGTVAEASGKTYSVVAESSMVMWEGYKLTGKHNGTINVIKGKLTITDGKLVSGKVALDMNSINCLDLEGDDKAYLEGHLKGMDDSSADDFFNVRKYPSSIFEITKVTSLLNNDKANNIIYGNLTMKEITKQISFKAQITVEGDMVSVSTEQFKIDRTEWGIKYKSASFFDGLKDKAISNDFGLNITLTAK